MASVIAVRDAASPQEHELCGTQGSRVLSLLVSARNVPQDAGSELASVCTVSGAKREPPCWPEQPESAWAALVRAAAPATADSAGWGTWGCAAWGASGSAPAPGAWRSLCPSSWRRGRPELSSPC